MYLIATHIPIFTDGDRTFVDDSWYADLKLARDFFSPYFRDVRVIGPQRPIEAANGALVHEVGRDTPNLSLHPSIDERTRVRHFWPAARRQWKRDLAPLLADARVVHGSVDDPLRPMQLATLLEAFEANKPTVLIGFDMDLWSVFRDQVKNMGAVQKQMHVVSTVGMDLYMRMCAHKASVAMLKDGLVYDRYASIAKNPQAFCHSMHGTRQLIDDDTYESRIRGLRAGRALRFGYFGRFVERKGLADAIKILARARALGVDASYHLVGDGPQQSALRALAAEVGVAQHVRFAGAFPYGDALHQQLRGFDALLFTPTEEDTPRMVYDAYAAGLPLVTSDIPFLRRCAKRDGASVVFGIGAVEDGARALLDLDRDRERFEGLSRRARTAGAHHTVENWYGRRLQWAVEAVERHEREQLKR